jgi:hypothetical protein
MVEMFSVLCCIYVYVVIFMLCCISSVVFYMGVPRLPVVIPSVWFSLF